MDEYYGGGRPQVPPRDVLVGQDLIRHQLQLNRQVGPVSEGHSTELMLCIVDPRLIPQDSETLTRYLQRLNSEIPGPRAVDRCLINHEVAERSAIGGVLVQFHYAIRMIRTGGQL